MISSTAADEPLLTRGKIAPIVRERWDRPLFIIDIAVPSDVAPEVNEMEGVYLYDIDSLQSIAEQSLALRREQIAASEEIIAEHVSDFRRWFGAGNNTPRLQSSVSTALDEALCALPKFAVPDERRRFENHAGFARKRIGPRSDNDGDGSIAGCLPGARSSVEIIRTRETNRAAAERTGRSAAGRKGLFTAEIERSGRGEIDVAVHSAKDFPVK